LDGEATVFDGNAILFVFGREDRAFSTQEHACGTWPALPVVHVRGRRYRTLYRPGRPFLTYGRREDPLCDNSILA
jgi:hypothetical protein